MKTKCSSLFSISPGFKNSSPIPLLFPFSTPMKGKIICYDNILLNPPYACWISSSNSLACSSLSSSVAFI